jgi:hypothetical protein
MKRKMVFAVMMLVLTAAGYPIGAQDKPKSSDTPKPEEHAAPPIPLRVQVVFTEYDGDKKTASLPYSFSVNADERRARPNTQIRDGARIPIYTNIKDQSLTYLDVGTNIDCSAQSQEDGRYKLVLTVERSSITQEGPAVANAPVVRSFKAEMNPILKDGQNFESVMATDPVNGHVYRVTVTLTVMK